MTGVPASLTLEDRVAMRVVDMSKVNGCWTWEHPSATGYAYMHWRGKSWKVTRLLWETFVGPIPEGYVLDHLCRNRACVNPDHVEPVTPRVNSQRGLAGHYLKGQTHCPKGHEFTPENTYVRPDGKRRCKPCYRARKKIWRQKQAALRGSWKGL